MQKNRNITSKNNKLKEQKENVIDNKNTKKISPGSPLLYDKYIITKMI